MTSRVLWGIVVSLLVLMLATDKDHNGADDRPRVSTDYTTTTTCQEDEACWDCQAMGNGICGTTNEGGN